MSDALWGILLESGVEPVAPVTEPSGEPSTLPTLSEVMSSGSALIPNSSSSDTSSVSDLLSGLSIIGIDASMASTGVWVFHDGTGYSFTLDPVSPGDSPFPEVVMRRRLGELLLDRVPSGVTWDHIAIEDVFVGRSHTVARSLYGINTFIDELILDGKISCKEFHRVNNVSWKARWSNWVGPGIVSSLPDKLKVRAFLSYSRFDSSSTCLQYLHGDDPGLQDRLDAFGVGVSVLLPSSSSPRVPLPPWGSVRVKPFDSWEELLEKLESLARPFAPYSGALSKPAIRKTLAADPSRVLFTPTPQVLGVLDPRSSDLLTPAFFAFYLGD